MIVNLQGRPKGRPFLLGKRYHFSGLKTGVTTFVEARGAGRNAPEASAGFHFATKTSASFRRRGRGASSPPHPRRNQRLMIPSGPPSLPGHGFPRPLRPTSFQRDSVLHFLKMSVTCRDSDYNPSPSPFRGSSLPPSLFFFEFSPGNLRPHRMPPGPQLESGRGR